MKTEIKKLSLTALVAVVSSLITVFAVNQFNQKNLSFQQKQANGVRFASYGGSSSNVGLPDFTQAAAMTTPAVVHIKTEYATTRSTRQIDPFRDFFGGQDFGFPQQQQPSEASGSGVIISDDGYIITNNHVVENGDNINVILYDKREYKATVVGTDPSTDLALLHIEEKQLPFIPFGNSDSVLVGQWVLAVGNPFNLESTVTAGIVSAKGRNINILRDKSNAPVEAFIQTDAAVNPGNSGGALVNTRGELIGINSAIATPTGTFAGYSFAIPINLAAKVMNDLKNYGVVKRGFLGVGISDISSDLAKEYDLATLKGVYVDSIFYGGAGAAAGLHRGDVITKVNGNEVNSSPELQEQISKFHPGDKIVLNVVRNGSEKMFNVTLMEKEETFNENNPTTASLDNLGADFSNLSAKDKSKLGVSGGVKVIKLRNGKLSQYTDIREGFVILKVNNKTVNSVDDLKNAMDGAHGMVMIQGTYLDYPGNYFYSFGIN